jgi:hypothetical protein
VILTVDLEKRDAEVKLLLGCTPKEAEVIRRAQAGILVARSPAA